MSLVLFSYDVGRCGLSSEKSEPKQILIPLTTSIKPPINAEVELTILMPCLNEAETIGTCIRKATQFLKRTGIMGEILIADNGSMDDSREIAHSLGARVVSISAKGYGAALIGGIEAAAGRYIIMGDADDSYDFSSLDNFVDQLRGGAHLVMGNRLRGIEPGAMPALHRYLGNPVLSFLGRLSFVYQSAIFTVDCAVSTQPKFANFGCKRQEWNSQAKWWSEVHWPDCALRRYPRLSIQTAGVVHPICELGEMAGAISSFY